MRPVFFALAAGFAALVAAAPLSAQTLVDFRFAPVPASVVQGVPFEIRIEAVDPSGAPATHLTGRLSLSARRYGPPTILISEVAGDLGAVEFTNPGATPVAVGDWELQAIHSGNPGQNPVRLRIPSPAVVPARGTFVWSASIPAPGNFPELGAPRPFVPPGAELGAVRLLNPEGELIDVVLLSEWAADAAEGHWNGGALGAPSDARRSLQRIGGGNTGSAWDWTTNTPSLGIPNPSLALPWLGSGRPTAVEPGSVSGAAGVWQGFVTLPEAGEAVTLLVDAGDGRLFESTLLQVLPRPALALEIPPAARTARESAAGPVGEGFVRLASPVSSNLTVILHLDSPGEFVVPNSVQIPAGATAASFPILNLDDDRPDGRARITLTAGVAGFEPVRAILVNDDDESGQVFLWAPDPVRESSGFQPSGARVFLPQPADHDVEIALSADPPLGVPPTVVIPTGQQAVRFPLRLEDDDRVNRASRTASLRATTASWPGTELALRVLDDDDPGFVVEMGSALVEGIPARGRVVLAVARDHEVTLGWTTDSPRLPVPEPVRIAAGTREGVFSVLVPDDTSLGGTARARLCPRLGEVEGPCVELELLDDEVEVSGARFEMPPAVFADRAVPVTLRLTDRYQATPRTNVTGLAALDVGSAVAALQPQPFPVPFEHGVYRGDLRFAGSALGAGIVLAVAGQSFPSAPIDILAGQAIPGPFADVASRPDSPTLLVLGGVSAETASHLLEIDPRTGITNRSLALPEPAHRLALAPDGAAVWVGCPTGTVQRVDLKDWTLGRTQSAATPGTRARVVDLVAAGPGGSRLLAVVDTNGPATRGPFQVVALTEGVRGPLSAALPYTSVAGNLLPGRTADEAVADWAGNLFVLAIDGDGVRIREELFVGFPTGTQPNLIRLGDLLYRGSGEAFSFAPLQRLEYRPGGPFVAPAEGGRALGYLDARGGFRVLPPAGDRVRGEHGVPWPEGGGGGGAARFVAWSDAGFAALTSDHAALIAWRSPLLGSPGADLAITGTGPERVEVGLTNGFPIAGPVAWTWTVTNHGPAVAHGVVATLDTGVRQSLGSLGPGEFRSVSDLRGLPPPAILRGSASVTSGTADPRPDNDTAWLRTELLGPSVAGVREWILDARHLAASADGQRLWVAVASPAREGGPGVLEVDPASGLVQRRLSTGAEPLQVAPTADGRHLYLRLGTSRVGRWNLAENAFDLDLAFEDETVTEILPLPASSRSVVVSTTRRVVVFDDAVARPDSIADPAERRHLGFARDRLWIAQPGRLRSCQITPTGLQPDGDALPLFVATDVYAFTGDDRRLYFPGVFFDLETRQTLPAPIGGPFLPEPARQALYAPSGRDLFRYDAATLGLLATERIPTLDTTPVGLARWGADGLAVLYHSGQLRVSRTPVVPEPGGGDLVVRIVPPPTPTAFVPAEWLVVVTNHSDQAVARVRLVVQASGEHRDASFDVPPDLAMLGEAFRDLGTLGPRAGVTWRFRASVFPGNFTLRAVLVSAAAGDLPGDNLAESTAYFGFPFGELAASLVSAPRQVGPGEVFPIRFRVANPGTVPAPNVGLQLTGPAGLEFVSIEPGSPAGDCCGERIEARIGSVAAGAAIDVEVRLRTRRPGLGLVALTVSDVLSETNYEDNLVTALVSTTGSEAARFRRFEYPPGHTVWSGARDELVAVFNRHPAVVTLGPDRLDPRVEVPLPEPPRQVAVSPDGQTAWVGLAGGDIARVQLDSGRVVQRFPCDVNTSIPFGALATLPGQPEVLVAAGVTRTGDPEVVAFRDGLPLPDVVRGLRWGGNGFFLHAAGGDRLFVSSGLNLRELRAGASGIVEVRNLDAAAWFGGAISGTPGHLVFSTGRVVDLATLGTDDHLISYAQFVADSAASILYRCLPDRTQFGGAPLAVEALDPADLSTLWRLEATASTPATGGGAGDFSRVVSLGKRGLLLLANQALRLAGDAAGSPSSDLGVAVESPTGPIGPNARLPVVVTVTHAGAWTARNAVLEIEPSGVLELLEPSLPRVDGRHLLPLGHLGGTTSLDLVLRPTAAGDGALRVRVRSDLPDPGPGNNEAAWQLRVPAPPVLLLDDTSLAEGNDPFTPRPVTALLSSPAPDESIIPFRLVPLTAQVEDLAGAEGVFRFERGATVATAGSVRGDSLPEPEETFRLELLPSPVSLSRTSAVFTILDDDRPYVAAQPTFVAEGHSGLVPATIPILLSPPVDHSVDVAYRIEAGTATAGVDFREQSGWLRFQPGQPTNLLVVALVGDTRYEPAETFWVRLTESPGAIVETRPVAVQIRNDDAPPAPVVTLSRQTDGTWRVHFDTVAGPRYRLQIRNDFGPGTWQTLSATVVGTGQPASLPVPASPSAARFLRIRAE